MNERIAVLGANGMLGSAVVKRLKELKRYEVQGFTRKELDAEDFAKHPHNKFRCEYVINCIGYIKPRVDSNITDAILINSVFPHKLADACKNANAKLIHITTDCVFSGNVGNYDEISLHDALDAYGKTKSLGEPTNCMTIRTSIIGEEQSNFYSLIEWVKKQSNQTINGFTNHFWNGVTTKEYANICDKIIQNDLYEDGLFHVFSPKIVSKLELVSVIAKRFDINCNIIPTDASQRVDRSLSTSKTLNRKLDIPSIYTQIDQL